MRIVRLLIASQMWLSKQFDRLLPTKFRIDGNRDFLNTVVPQYLRPGLQIYDIGGGKQPCITKKDKSRLCLRIVGLDLSQEELMQAPAGIYDRTIVADIQRYRGDGLADVVICQALLEHVPNATEAIAGLASIVKENGHILIFSPSRRAIFARLNRLLPQRIKKALLFTVFPHTKTAQGFPSYYDKCTANEFRGIAQNHGLTEVTSKAYYLSSYFSFFFPLYFAWRIWTLVAWLIQGTDAAETFTIILSKPAENFTAS